MYAEYCPIFVFTGMMATRAGICGVADAEPDVQRLFVPQAGGDGRSKETSTVRTYAATSRDETMSSAQEVIEAAMYRISAEYTCVSRTDRGLKILCKQIKSLPSVVHLCLGK